MQISLQHIAIHPALQGYIEKLWVFESSGRMPGAQSNIIVPNGMVKLIIPFRNGLLGQRDGYARLSNQNQMTLIGLSDTPFVVDACHDAPLGTIGVEFSPLGAHRFFKLRHSELRNQIFLASEVIGKRAGDFEERMAGTDSIEQKLQYVQTFLQQLFYSTRADEIFEYCVQKIRRSHGLITVRELEKATGYSSRWLNIKFEERIGTSPKNLCAITRFQWVYQTLVNRPAEILENKQFYHIYYDQSHFIREFKRFTGFAPTHYERQPNEFGKIFYRE